MGLAAGVLASPQAASASTFNQADGLEWGVLDQSFNNLLGQIKEATDALKPGQSNAIVEFVLLYMQLEALHERTNHILSLVALSSQFENANDERRTLQVLGGMLLPSSKALAQGKRSSLIKIGSATNVSGLYPHYVTSALTLIDTKVLPLIDKTAAKILATDR